ncbi:MAG: nicotinate phosphoribosyltransferase [Rhodospirillales bacterium]|nr:nicotinate phosphoribosyltransferase [Rhodospirillales bacterium]
MSATSKEISSGIEGGSGLLLTDLYQLNMMQAYLDAGMTETAVFEFFVRKLPENRGFLVAAGLEQALDFLEMARFTEDELAWLKDSGRFRAGMLDYLARLRFSGDVDAVAEGTVFFPDEPILRVAAPLPVAQLVETRLINLLHFQTVIASKAARMVLVAPGKQLVDFGLRRAHGAEAGLLAARASYLAGFAGSATTPAQRRYGVPIFGTMAHSFIQAFETEEAAFAAFARSRPENVVLLLDTYDTEAAAHKVVTIAPRLKQEGIELRGVRLDSGDLAGHARRVRRILDEGGLKEVTVFASGGLDETVLQKFIAEGAPIDGYGIGTSLTTASDAPALDCAYKLQEYAGEAKRKRSEGKATWPGRKQVFRRRRPDGTPGGTLDGDLLTLEGAPGDGDPLIQPVMRQGRRLEPPPPLDQVRARAAAELAALPAHLARLETAPAYPVEVSRALRDLAEEVDRRHGKI